MEIVRIYKKVLLLLVGLFLISNLMIIGYQGYKIFVLDQHNTILTTSIIQPIKVFQIGFSKCGTKSLNDLFQYSGIPSVHHAEGQLAITMFANYQQGLPLLNESYDQFFAYFDMERRYDYPPISVPVSLFKELDRQYPGSKFILNTRDKQAWLKSMARHPAYHQKMRWLELHAKFYNISHDQVLAMWSQEWDEHHAAVLEYFKDRPDDLLVFDIEQDSPKKLVAFFKEYFVLKPRFYKHANKSSDRDKQVLVDY